MMTDLNSLSDRELRAKLQQYGIDTTITAATRSLFIRQLKAATEESSNGIWHDEPVDNHPSSMRRRSAVKSELQFSEQHSLTMGHCTPLDSKSKLNTSDASNIFIPSPSVVVKLFVEGQERSPYDTGSDSEADEKTTKSPGVQKRNWAIPSWLSTKVHPTVQVSFC